MVNTGLIGKLYTITVFGKTTKGANQKIDDFVLPCINHEPTKNDLMAFLRNFRPMLFKDTTKVEWEFIRDMNPREY